MVSSKEKKVVVAAVAGAENAVVVVTANGGVVVTANGVVETDPKLKVRIAEVATTEPLAKTKMGSSLKERKLSAEAAEAVVASTATVLKGVIAAAEVNVVREVANAASTVVAVIEGAEIVPRRRVQPNQLSSNNKISEKS